MLAKIVLILLCVTLAISQEVIPGHYIVVLHDDADFHEHMAAVNSTFEADDTIHHMYSSVLKGYAGKFSDKVMKTIKAHKAVKSIEEDQIVRANAINQTNAVWGLSRISRQARGTTPLNWYAYSTQAGSGITIYVIDTGILTTHNEFTGRISWGTNTVGDLKNTDCNGHGTHVASTAGGTVYGVAKKSTLVAVKVLGCDGSGSNAGVISGIDYVSKNMVAVGKCVTNMSLGGGASTATDTAVTNLANKGCLVVVAAGNSNADACTSSPARAPACITVGSTTDTDTRSSFSNYGSCVDVFAPGSAITAAWIGSNSAIQTISGTSMASPHVAGIAAVQLSTGQPNSAVTNGIVAKGTANAINLACSAAACNQSPNMLAYSPYS